MELTKAGLSSLPSLPKLGEAGGTGAGGASFGDALKTVLNQTAEAQTNAQQMTVAAANGDSVALQDVVQAISKAELTLQTLVTVRDKAVEAYQEIMRMPV